MSTKKCKDKVKYKKRKDIAFVMNLNNLYNVMTKDDGGLINLRVDPALRSQFKAAAKMMGFKGMSGAIHFFIVKSINDQKERNPDEFARLLKAVEEEELRKKGLTPLETVKARSLGKANENEPKPKQKKRA